MENVQEIPSTATEPVEAESTPVDNQARMTRSQMADEFGEIHDLAGRRLREIEEDEKKAEKILSDAMGGE